MSTCFRWRALKKPMDNNLSCKNPFLRLSWKHQDMHQHLSLGVFWDRFCEAKNLQKAPKNLETPPRSLKTKFQKASNEIQKHLSFNKETAKTFKRHSTWAGTSFTVCKESIAAYTERHLGVSKAKAFALWRGWFTCFFLSFGFWVLNICSLWYDVVSTYVFLVACFCE